MYYNYTITDFIYSIQYNRNVLQFYVGSILRKSILRILIILLRIEKFKNNLFVEKEKIFVRLRKKLIV